MIKHISCDCKFNSVTCISNQIIINVNPSVKSIIRAKKDYSWNPDTCICENSTSLKSVIDN